MTTPKVTPLQALSTAVNAVDSVIAATDLVKQRLIEAEGIEAQAALPYSGATAILNLLCTSLADDARGSAVITPSLPILSAHESAPPPSPRSGEPLSEIVGPTVDKTLGILGDIYWFASQTMSQLAFVIEDESEQADNSLSDSTGSSTTDSDEESDDEDNDSSDLLVSPNSASSVESAVQAIHNATIEMELTAHRSVLVSQQAASRSKPERRIGTSAITSSSSGASSAASSPTESSSAWTTFPASWTLSSSARIQGVDTKSRELLEKAFALLSSATATTKMAVDALGKALPVVKDIVDKSVETKVQAKASTASRTNVSYSEEESYYSEYSVYTGDSYGD